MQIKCEWHEYGEKSSKIILNLEKTRAIQNQTRLLKVNEHELKEKEKINNELHQFYQNLFSKNINNSQEKIVNYLNNTDTSKLSNEQREQCEGKLRESEVREALSKMENNKLPGNNGLTKEFYEALWLEIKNPVLKSFKKAFFSKELSISQKQAVIKLIEKKDRDKHFIKNWRPISLLNIDGKLVSKVLAKRIKKLLPFLISSNQTAYVENRYISEGGRLFSDILEITDLLKIDGLLVTLDIEKAFDSIDHMILINTLENFSFGKDFIRWIKILLKNQESCIINGTTTKNFKLNRGTCQGNPISAYLFILVLEVVVILIKANNDIKGLTIFSYNFLYTAYADDNTFFLKNQKSVLELLKVFDEFSLFQGLRPNKM